MSLQDADEHLHPTSFSYPARTARRNVLIDLLDGKGPAVLDGACSVQHAITPMGL